MLSLKHPRLSLYARALAYFRSDRHRLAVLFVLIACSTGLGLLQVWPLAILLDGILAPGSSPYDRWLPAGSVWTQVLWLGGTVLLMRLLQEVAGMCRTLVHLQVSHGGLMRIRCDLFRKLQALHLDYHRRQPQGDAIYRLSSDAASLPTILNVTLDAIVAAATLIVMLGIMLSCSVSLTLLALLVAPLLLVTNLMFGQVLQKQSSVAKRCESEFTSVIQRSLSAMSLVQAFGREMIEYGRFRSSVHGTNRAWYQLHWQMAFYRFCVGLIFGLGGASIFVYGGYLVYQSQVLGLTDAGMTIGELTVFLSYLAMFYDPLCKISGAGTSLQTAAAGVERVFEILDKQPVICDRANALELPRQPRVLTLENVGFSYGEGKQVLQSINATIRPGEMVAFVGPSGVGKSTLLNLLPRFFDPTAGALLLDGHDARQVRLRDLRRHVALVLQESVILPTTVAENIAYGRPDASLAEVIRVAELAGASRFIEEMPLGYNTPISEGGQNLSGGQRQRIAIARALLTEAPIIVLDEPTSALDAENERLICETLRSLKGLRTLVLVSHRLTTLTECDQIFVMNDGQVVGCGTHEDLIRRRGWYYDTARQQFAVTAATRKSAAA